MAVHRNRLDENKGTFGPFVAGQKDEQKKVAYMRISVYYIKKEGCHARTQAAYFVRKQNYRPNLGYRNDTTIFFYFIDSIWTPSRMLFDIDCITATGFQMPLLGE